MRMQDGRSIAAGGAETRTRLLCAIVAAGALCIAGIFLVEYRLSPDRSRLSRTGCRKLRATIVSKGKGLEERGGMQFPVYLVAYGFTIDGKRYEGRGRVDRESYTWLAAGSEVVVYFDAARPERNFLKHEYDLQVGRLLAAVRLASGVFAASLLLALFPRCPARLWARRRPAGKTGP